MNDNSTQSKNIPTLSYIEDLARKAGEIVKNGYAQQHQVKFKGEIDLVTEIDHQSEAYLLDRIKNDFTDHAILAEESGQTKGMEIHQWYIDPLDGTVNYAHNIPIFCVSIAYAHEGVVQLGVVYDPLRDECYKAQRGKSSWLNGAPLHASTVTEPGKGLLVTGFPYNTWNTRNDNTQNFINFGKKTQGVRRLGSAALDLCYVAAGRFEGYWELSLSAWDVAAGGLIAEEAGAKVTNILGGADYISKPQSILACAPGLHQFMIEELEKNQKATNKRLKKMKDG
jgi:myo-inositol-1(or 4)-monophosphatase